MGCHASALNFEEFDPDYRYCGRRAQIVSSQALKHPNPKTGSADRQKRSFVVGTFDQAVAERDDVGVIRQLNHLDEPYRAPGADAALEADAVGGAEPMTARKLADIYLREAIPFMELDSSVLAATSDDADENDKLVFHEEHSIMGNTAVSYMQTVQGIPVWESGMAVQVEDDAMQVIGSQNTMQIGLKLKLPPDDAPYNEGEIDEQVLVELMGFESGAALDISHKEKFIYKYRAGRRIEGLHEDPIEGGAAEPGFVLPPVGKKIKDNNAYVVTAVQFTHTSSSTGEEGWLAMIEAATGSVLYLRSLRGCAMHATLNVEERLGDRHDDGPPVGEIAVHAGEAVGTARIVFFDIGDTLGRGIFGPSGELLEIRLFADVLERLQHMNANGVRIGIISDPGAFDTGLIRSLLQDTGAFDFIDASLVFFGPKDGTSIFENSALAAGVAASECLFVGENQTERDVASSAGFRVATSPQEASAATDPDATLAWVYLQDPATKAGAAGPRPDSSLQSLDQFRDLVALRGLTPPAAGSGQALSGEFIRLQNIDTPNPTLPTSPPPGDFRFSVNTNDFGAANAYHNCDRLFRILEEFGMDVRSYFDGTNFPVRVDHRVRYTTNPFLPPTANVVNASAPGFTFPPRSDGFRFALAARNTAVGMATAWRVVLHEFGHALLWDNVGSPNFRFAHSAGDALAAILNDAGNQAARHLTFPWVSIGRSHMRPVTDFAWYGTRYEPFDANGEDRAGYVAEQMLSSTLFRAYQAAGGDSTDRQEQEFAARYVVFLVMKAIRLMSTFNNPSGPEGFADLMMQADAGTFPNDGVQRQIGLLRKVIRWAFEMQGAYRQPASSVQVATNQIGNPPPVDVYINDGRDGQYHFAKDIDALDIWNRQTADGGTVHQEPVMGQLNFAFARISNRGLSQATNISVHGFQSVASGDHVWPNDWHPLTTPSLQSAAGIASGGGLVVGPFSWVPVSSTPTVLMSVSASNDQSNLSRFTSANPVATRQLALWDNNTALRSMPSVAHPSAQPVG